MISAATIPWHSPDTAPLDGTPMLIRLAEPVNRYDMVGSPPFDLTVVVGWWAGHGFEAMLAMESRNPSDGSSSTWLETVEPLMWAPLPVGDLTTEGRAVPAAVHVPNLPPHVLKAYRLLEELAEAKRISTVEWDAISRAITRRAPGYPREAGYVVPGWSLEEHVISPKVGGVDQ